MINKILVLIGAILFVALSLFLFFFKQAPKTTNQDLTTNLPREHFDISPLPPSDKYDVSERVEIGELPTTDITLTKYSNKKYPFKEPETYLGQNPLYLEPADVDGDGKEEKIVLSWSAMTRGPHNLQIVKDEEVIFEATDLPRVWFEPSGSHKGFYVGSEIGESGSCCFAGKKLVRFILENGEFRPVWEQKIHYMRITK